MISSSSFVGLSKKGAQDRAESLNLVFRLVSVDGVVMLDWPTETLPDRICCAVVRGKVTEARLQ